MPKLKPIPFGNHQNPTVDCKNILFLGDGFSADDEKLFDDVVEKFNDRFFRMVEPFNLPGVREKINIFSYFTPTPAPIDPNQASGISCEYWVDVDNRPVAPHTPGSHQLATKDSFFGLQFSSQRGIKAKIGHEDAIVDFIFNPLDPLTHPTEAVGATAIPDCWAPVGSPTPMQPHLGSSRGMVVVLVNDDLGKASSLSGFSGAPDVGYACAVSIGLMRKFHHVSMDFSIGGVWTHFPRKPPRRKISGIRRHALKFNQINDVIAHELAHSAFNLADEYIAKGDLHDSGAGGKPADYSEPNVISRSEASDPITGAFTHVKWKADMWAIVRMIIEGAAPIPNGPLHLENCTGIANGAPYPDWIYERSLPTDPRILLLANHPADVIGLYEGAKYQKCGVYRPAGRCKMRKTADVLTVEQGRFRAWSFCYVCKKAIINVIDPALIPALRAQQYPGI
jgi:hypothetical protein